MDHVAMRSIARDETLASWFFSSCDVPQRDGPDLAFVKNSAT